MKRRTAIRNVVLVAAGAAFLKSCGEKPATITLDHIPLTGSQQDLLNELTEAILPKTDFVGAKDLQTTEFILTMVDDCASPEDQKKFADSMNAFDEACKAKVGDRFADCSADQRKQFLTLIEGDKEKKELPADVVEFYRQIKGATIRNFTSSEPFYSQVRGITTLIPPKFQACVPVTNA